MSKKFYDNTVFSLYLLVLFLLYYHRQHQCQQYQHPRRHLCPSWMLRGTFSTLVTTPGWVEATNYPSEMFDASTRGKVFFCAIFTADHFYVGKKWVEELSTTFHSTCLFFHVVSLTIERYGKQGRKNCRVSSPRHFRDKKYRILTFLSLVNSGSLLLSLTHSDSLWLTLPLSGSLWLSLWLTLAHSGSIRRSSAHKVLARLATLWQCGQSLSRPSWQLNTYPPL